MTMDIGIFGGFVSGVFFLMLSTFAFFVWAPLPFLDDNPGDDVDRLLASGQDREVRNG
jgi:hypothetical protein